MKKQRKIKQAVEIPTHNPVAKYAHYFNKAQVFTSKRHYQRKAKHNGLEPLLIA